MKTLLQLSDFIQRAASDERLKPTHISLYFALCHAWIINGFQECYNVSRKQLMSLSHIRSKATYHKVIKELTNLGYIQYRPSYHPFEGSEVSLVQRSVCFDPASVEKDDDLSQDCAHFLATSDGEAIYLDQDKAHLRQGTGHLDRFSV